MSDFEKLLRLIVRINYYPIENLIFKIRNKIKKN